MLHAGNEPPRRVDLPDQWPEVAVRNEPSLLTRHFNCPTGLLPGDRVELVLAHFPAQAEIQVNEQPLGLAQEDGTQFRVEITPHLQSRNLVSVALPSAPAPNSNSPQAHLEIFVR